MGNISSEESCQQDSSGDKCNKTTDHDPVFSDQTCVQDSDTLTGTLDEVRKMLDSKQEFIEWYFQIDKIEDYLNKIRREYLRNADCKDAMVLQRKMFRSASDGPHRSYSCSERFISYGKKQFPHSKPRREKSVESCSPGVHHKCLETALVDFLNILNCFPEFRKILRTSRSEEKKQTTTSKMVVENIGSLMEAMAVRTEKFEKYFKSMTKIWSWSSENNVAPEDDKENRVTSISQDDECIQQDLFSQYYEEMKEFLAKMILTSPVLPEDDIKCEKNGGKNVENQFITIGLENDKMEFVEIYRNFIDCIDICKCTFWKDGRGVEKATLLELAHHAHHRMQSTDYAREIVQAIITEETGYYDESSESENTVDEGDDSPFDENNIANLKAMYKQWLNGALCSGCSRECCSNDENLKDQMHTKSTKNKKTKQAPLKNQNGFSSDNIHHRKLVE